MKPLDLNSPHLIIMIGIPGSGKTYFAEKFAKTFKAPLISFENLLTNLSKLSDDKKILIDVVNNIMTNTLLETAKSQRTIIYDGQNNSRLSCDSLVKTAKSLGYEPMFVWVQTDINTAKKRFIKTMTKKAIADKDDFEKLSKNYSPIDRNKKNFVVISGKHTYSNQLKIVLKYLSQPKK